MNTDDFLIAYWKQYIEIEKEFMKTIPFVTLDPENTNAFSGMYLKLILQIGSECDIVLKKYCQYLDMAFKGESIDSYQACILNHDTTFAITEVAISLLNEKSIQPWKSWIAESKPNWWKTYNKVKHDRTGVGEIGGTTKEYLKFANQEYTIFSLAGLYIVEIELYYRYAVNEKKIIQTPLPGSRLFRLIGGIWDRVNFFQDIGFYVDETGNFYQETGPFSY